MEDDDIEIANACADLLGLKANEKFPLHLLRDKRAGEWIGVGELCRQSGVGARPIKPALFVTWLPDPIGHQEYAVVLFYDEDSQWSMAAHYNRGRLIPGVTPNGPSAVASDTLREQAVPAAERQQP